MLLDVERLGSDAWVDCEFGKDPVHFIARSAAARPCRQAPRKFFRRWVYKSRRKWRKLSGSPTQRCFSWLGRICTIADATAGLGQNTLGDSRRTNSMSARLCTKHGKRAVIFRAWRCRQAQGNFPLHSHNHPLHFERGEQEIAQYGRGDYIGKVGHQLDA